MCVFSSGRNETRQIPLVHALKDATSWSAAKQNTEGEKIMKNVSAVRETELLGVGVK